MTSLFKRLWYCLNSLIKAVEAITCSDCSPLDQLPDDVVRKIFENLCTGDRVRMRLVSKSWRRMLMQDDIPVAPETPWLILSNDSYLKPEYFLWEICFNSLSEERIYRFKLPAGIINKGILDSGYWCCCGSSRGWLLIGVGHNLHNTDMFLWNPVSGQTKKLPPLSTLPFFNQFVDDAIQSGVDNISCFIPRMQIFSVGTVECIVAIILINPVYIEYKQQQLALCTPHDQSWSMVGGGEKQHLYKDIFFHNGKLYASCELEEGEEEQLLGGGLELEIDDHDKIIRKGMYRVHLAGGCDVEVDMLRFVYHRGVAAAGHDERIPIGFRILERVNVVEHLMESCSTGELLVVSAIQDLSSHNNLAPDDQAAAAGPIKKFYLCQTRGFEVRRVTGDCLEKVIGSIGDQEAIFVGGNDSLSLPAAASYINQVEADCIYFATDDGSGMVGLDRIEEENVVDDDEIISWDRMYIVREQGVFNLQENRIWITSLTNLCVPLGSITGWFTPKLF